MNAGCRGGAGCGTVPAAPLDAIVEDGAEGAAKDRTLCQDIIGILECFKYIKLAGTKAAC